MSLRPHARRGDWGRGEVLLTLYGIVWELNYYVIQGLDLTTFDQRKWAAGFDYFRKCHGTFDHIRTGLQHEFLFRAARSTSQATPHDTVRSRGQCDAVRSHFPVQLTSAPQTCLYSRV